ncbi:MAG: hypothetical protein KIT25_24545 [Enhydrobacter sp.]|nr:MAG: hypothetical protein KIT25_24545 [Enhydrobacter sp.]
MVSNVNGRLLRQITLAPVPQCDKAGFAAANTPFANTRYSDAMASENDDASDVDRLARRYLDLWQTQLSGLASDQALTEQIVRLFASANAQMASVIQAAQGATHAASSPPGTSPAAAASGHGTDDLGELRKRVAALEARIAELESKLRGS